MKPETLSDYEIQARAVAEKIGITVAAVYTGNECPPWSSDGKHKSASSCPKCGSTHGDRFVVTITKSGRRPLVFPFWASFADCYVERYPRGGKEMKFADKMREFPGPDHGYGPLAHVKHTPSCYDILACLSSDASCPTDPDEVVAEFGPMKPSQAIAVAESARRLQAFFTSDELAILSEVQ